MVPGGLDIYLDVSEGGKGYVISVHYSMQTLNAVSDTYLFLFVKFRRPYPLPMFISFIMLDI